MRAAHRTVLQGCGAACHSALHFVPAPVIRQFTKRVRCAAAAATGSRRALLMAGVALGGAAFLRGNVAMAASGGEIEKILVDPRWPEQWPFRPEDFLRYDETSDGLFYNSPRFVYHIDEGAVGALTEYYKTVFPPSGAKDTALLDICSSWVSHYPEGYTAGRISGLGMNQEELARNPILTDYAVHDLNEDPTLPYDDNTFDVVTNAVSVDYLNKPLEVFKEIQRVLKPGGSAYMSFSNRCFPTKAIALWTATGDADHCWIVGSYFHYAGGFAPPKSVDISPRGGMFGGKGDPMYVVTSQKL